MKAEFTQYGCMQCIRNFYFDFIRCNRRKVLSTAVADALSFVKLLPAFIDKCAYFKACNTVAEFNQFFKDESVECFFTVKLKNNLRSCAAVLCGIEFISIVI